MKFCPDLWFWINFPLLSNKCSVFLSSSSTGISTDLVDNAAMTGLIDIPGCLPSDTFLHFLEIVLKT